MRCIVIVVNLVGCGVSGHTTLPASSSQRATAPTPSASSAPTTPTTLGGVFGKVEGRVCRLDAQTVQEASDAYRAQYAHPAPSMAAFVTVGILRSVPSSNNGYVILYDPATGHVSATGACNGP